MRAKVFAGSWLVLVVGFFLGNFLLWQLVTS